MMNADDIAKTAAHIRSLGVPDQLNRWLKMTPASYRTNQAAIGRIAAQQRGVITVKNGSNVMSDTELKREFNVPLASAETVTKALDRSSNHSIPSETAAPTAAAKPKETTVKTTAAKKPAASKSKIQKPDAKTRRSPEQAKANARTPVKPDLKATGTHAKPKSKSGLVDQMLKKAAGATKAELSAATGWPSVNLRVAAERAGCKLVEKSDRFRLVPDVASAGEGWKAVKL